MRAPAPRAIRLLALTSLLLVVAALWAVKRHASVYGDTYQPPIPAPEFTHQSEAEWLNSAPLTLESLRGRVVLLDVWTFDCNNCYRSFPWQNSLEAKYQSAGLTVIGIHSPEYDHERERRKVAEKAQQFGLHHPIMIDNDFSYWAALDNYVWPTYYLIDKRGYLRRSFIGETHAGDARAEAIERAIEELLAEPLA